MASSSPSATFLGAPFAPRPESLSADFAFLGIPQGVPYGGDSAASPSAGAPDAVRSASLVYRHSLHHYDFDLGGPLFLKGAAGRLGDCGDVPGGARDAAEGMARATGVVQGIVACGAIPLVVGGDHSIPPMVVRGLPDDEPLDVLHIDAHLDFRDDVDGVRDGYSSPIRRLRDLPWVRRVVQVGLRDSGSAREADVTAALDAGNVLVTAADVHEHGVDRVIERFEGGARLYITIDVDGLDPSCAPGTMWPAPGGLWFWQTARLVSGLSRRCRLAGIDVCEFAPAHDPLGHTALVVTRLLMLAMGGAQRSAS